MRAKWTCELWGKARRPKVHLVIWPGLGQAYSDGTRMVVVEEVWPTPWRM